MDWKDTLLKIAPTVVSAVAGPLGGAAVMALGEIFGISEPTQDKIKSVIESGGMDGEQLSRLKELEMKLKAEEAERGFKYAELEYKDRDSARQREVATGDKVNRNLAYFIIAAFVAMVGSTLSGFTVVDSALAGTLIGYMSAKAEQILSYYFGSTASGQRKTELLAKAEPIK